MTEQTLFDLARQLKHAEEEESNNHTSGKSFLQITKSIGNKATMLGAMAAGGAAALGKPLPPKQIDPRY